MALSSISEYVWDSKYRFKTPDNKPIDKTTNDTWARVAKALAAPEHGRERTFWGGKFEEVMSSMKFLPAGRVLAGAGTNRTVTLFNCFVLGAIPDSYDSIMDGLKEAGMTMRQGGGIGHDFSTLRPCGSLVKGVGTTSRGPLSFIDLWNAMSNTVLSAGNRQGAMMGTLRCDHPDIEAFIEAKRNPEKFRQFNFSVLVTDKFMSAVTAGNPWDLQFAGKIYKTIDARKLWNKLMRATYDVADPGVIFIDRINATNPLNYCETITCTNPCGEQPLPPYGACLLGSINLTKFIDEPFTPQARLNIRGLEDTAAIGVRALDNVIDISNFPLPQQREEALNKRRIGLGITGLADALIMLGFAYSSDQGVDITRNIMSIVNAAAREASEDLGKEKGNFPLFNELHYFNQKFRRNSHVTSIAPTGTISLLMGNVSSGIEPIFDLKHKRKVRRIDGDYDMVEVMDFAFESWQQKSDNGILNPDLWETVAKLQPKHHLAIQAACQSHVDSSISKTINCPANINFEDFKSIYEEAYQLGCKGCTTYRPNPTTGNVLSSETMQDATDNTITVLPALVEKPDRSMSAISKGNVVELTPAFVRPKALEAVVYKLKPPGAEHAMYVTISDTEDQGRKRPFEMFINTKNIEYMVWAAALTRMISAIFRRGGDLSFIQEELSAVYDPRGGYWADRHFYPSIIAGIGNIVAEHLAKLQGTEISQPNSSAGLHCPQCQHGKLIMQEGCHHCDSCSFSKC